MDCFLLMQNFYSIENVATATREQKEKKGLLHDPKTLFMTVGKCIILERMILLSVSENVNFSIVFCHLLTYCVSFVVSLLKRN